MIRRWLSPLLLNGALILVFVLTLLPTLHSSGAASDLFVSAAVISSRPKLSTPVNKITPTPTDIWFSFQSRTPYPYSTPLPEPVWTPLDGVYAKFDTSRPQWWECRRCADYRPMGGIWKLQFDRGIMRIFYQVNGWKTIASYRLVGDNLYIFNDPICPWETGEYHWTLENRTLILDLVQDTCSIRLRGKNLSQQPWRSCLPPNVMTGASDHWNKPRGCE